MLIPKGLIIYRATRHQSIYPVNLKHRCYSNKFTISRKVPNESLRRVVQPRLPVRVTKMAKISKLIRCFDLSLDLDHLNETHIMHHFSKLHHIKKCFIRMHREDRFAEKSRDLAINLLRKAFRTLKELEQVHLGGLLSLQEDFKTFKNLLLQRSLQKLTVSPLEITQDVNDLTPFLKLSQSAHRRKCWPHLNSLRLDLESFEMYVEDPAARRNMAGLDSNLLKFLQDFKSCESLYKCSQFHLMMPQEGSSNRSQEELAAFGEVLKMGLPITEIEVYQGMHIESLLKAAQNLKHLKSLHLQLVGGLSENPELNSYQRFPNLQEISLVIDCEDEPDSDRYGAGFSYFSLHRMQSMTHLKSLSLYFDGDPSRFTDLLQKALSKLTNLIHLTLSFPNMINFEDQFIDFINGRKLDWSWLKKVFEAVGKMTKLTDFYLEFENFNFKGANGIFKNLCQALGNLTQLSSLQLMIEEAEAIKDQDLCTLATYLGRLTKMESLNLSLGDSTQFKPATFAVLMDSIGRNLRILSELNMKVQCSEVTKQCYQAVYEGIHQMKHLNRMKIEVGGGTIGSGANMELLNCEVRNRMAGEVYSLKTNMDFMRVMIV